MIEAGRPGLESGLDLLLLLVTILGADPLVVQGCGVVGCVQSCAHCVVVARE